MPVPATRPTKTHQLQTIVEDYIAAGEPWPADRKRIAAWAVQTRRWTAPRKSAIDQCAKELADAMRLEVEKDPQGRTVRAKHCVKVMEEDEAGNLVQKTLWFDRENAPPHLMHQSLQQRRRAILSDCRQLKTDLDSYNENNTHGAEVQLSFDFRDDLIEAEESTEYCPPPFEG